MGEVYSIEIDTSKIDLLLEKIEKLQNSFKNIQTPSMKSNVGNYQEKINDKLYKSQLKNTQNFQKQEQKEEEKLHKDKIKQIKDEEKKQKTIENIFKKQEQIVKQRQTRKAQSFRTFTGNVKDVGGLASTQNGIGSKLGSAMSMFARNPSMSDSAGMAMASGGSMAAVGGASLAVGALTKTFKVLAKAGLILAGIFTALGIASMRNVSETKMAGAATGMSFGQTKGMEFASNMMGFGREGFGNAITSMRNNMFKYGQAPAGYAGLGLDWEKMKEQDASETFFQVLEALNKHSEENGGGLPEDVLSDFASRTGLDYNTFRGMIGNKALIQQGRGYYQQGAGLFGGQSGNGLQSGERSIKLFHAQLESLGMMIGGQIAPVLSMVLKNLIPYIKDFAKGFIWLVKSIFSEDNMKRFQKMFDEMRKVFIKLVDRIFSQQNLAKLASFVDKLIIMLGQLAKYIFSDKNIEFIGKIFDDLFGYLEDIDFETGLKTLKKVADVLMFLGNTVLSLLTNVAATIDNLAGLVQFITGDITFAQYWNKLGDNGNKMIKGILRMFGADQPGLKIQDALEKGNYTQKDLDKYIQTIQKNKTGWGERLSKATPGTKEHEQSSAEYKFWTNLENNTLQHRKPVNDFILSKNGDVISTHPDDYIFGMKNPKQLASNGETTYNININANVRNDNDVAQIRNDLERLVRDLSRTAIRI